MNIQPDNQVFARRAEEAAFDIEEIFFSRTDERGVIEAGNEVFRRISGYSWDELVGAPHKIIRHPDMPKGVFHILWQRIQAGLPTGAYVKNRAKDGKFYWVFAIVSPIEGGYVSIRIKPTSKVFETVPDTYKDVLMMEQNDSISPEESAQKIRATLKTLGFPTYASFSSYALAHEMSARDLHLGRSEDSRVRNLKSLLPELEKMEADQRELFGVFDKIQGVPSNMRIVASRLEPAGGPISAISQNYRLMSGEVTDHLSAFLDADNGENLSVSILKRVYEALFIVCVSRIQREVRATVEDSLKNGGEAEGFANEVGVMTDLLASHSKSASERLTSVYMDISRLMQSSRDLKQLVTGLDSIRVLCRVEAGRLGSNSAALTPVIDQLDQFHVEIEKTLERILHYADEVTELVELSMPRAGKGGTLQPEAEFR